MKFRAIYIFFIVLFFSQLAFAQVRPESLKRNAVSLMQDGNYGEAINILNKFIVAKPRLGDGYHLRALCYEQRANYPYAVFDLRRAIKLDPDNKTIRDDYARVIEYFHAYLRKKIEGYKREIAIDPSNPFNYLEIGKANAHLHLEDYPTAEYWYDEYLKRDDNASPDEVIRYTLVLQETGHLVKGERILKKYTERYPGDWRIWSRYGYFTLWLGKFKTAENAFSTALSFKPFFKEAQDGLDLAQREGYITQYDQDILDENRRRINQQREYPIDRLYRIIRNDPSNDDARFDLISELINVGRYQEAYEQSQILLPNYTEDERFIALYSEILRWREQDWNQKIDSAMDILASNPTDGQAAKDIAKYYSSLEQNEEAIEILEEYIILVPDDAEAYFLLSQIFASNRDFENGILNAEKALELEPDNTNYLLQVGKITTWQGNDYEKAEEILLQVLDREPENFYALVTLGIVNYSVNKYSKAEGYVNKAKEIDPDNPEVQQLVSMLEFQLLRVGNFEAYEGLTTGRDYVNDGDCVSAIPYFEDYLRYNDNPTTAFRIELAGLYSCAEYYDRAIEQYDIVIDNEPDIFVEKQRAKAYFWNDSSKIALSEFQRLHEDDPNDQETWLWLADTYAKNKMYDEARDAYDEIEENFPGEFDIQERIGWLPKQTSLWGISEYIFSYLFLNPRSYYFNDNLDFEYMYAGLSGEIGFLPWLSFGADYVKGSISNANLSIPYSNFMWKVYIRPSERVTLSGGYGDLLADGFIDQPTWEANINYEREEIYKASLTYQHTNAALVLYTPNLVGANLAANSIRFEGFMDFKSSLRLETVWQFVLVNAIQTIPKNIGNTFNGRISRKFYPELRIGYEFEFTDYKYSTNLYWTPEQYSHHALWGEWQIIKDYDFDFNIGAKIGYVPASDFILRAAWSEFKMKLLPNLNLVVNGYLGSTVREITGYSSGALTASLAWTIF